MKKLFCFVLSFIFFANGKSQTTTIDSVSQKIPYTARNVYRIFGGQALFSDYETYVAAFNYERMLLKGLTLNTNAGIGIGIRRFGNDGITYGLSFHGYTAGEIRYYYGRNRRIKKQRPIYKNSGSYISLHQNFYSSPFSFINQNEYDAHTGSINTFLNFGYQKNISKFYINFYFGRRLGTGISLFKFGDPNTLLKLHGGIKLGYVFK